MELRCCSTWGVGSAAAALVCRPCLGSHTPPTLVPSPLTPYSLQTAHYPTIPQGKPPQQVAQEVCDRCLAPDTSSQMGRGCDNMSCMVVVLKQTAKFAKKQ